MKCEAKACKRRMRVAAQSSWRDLPVLAVNKYRGLTQHPAKINIGKSSPEGFNAQYF